MKQLDELSKRAVQSPPIPITGVARVMARGNQRKRRRTTLRLTTGFASIAILVALGAGLIDRDDSGQVNTAVASNVDKPERVERDISDVPITDRATTQVLLPSSFGGDILRIDYTMLGDRARSMLARIELETDTGLAPAGFFVTPDDDFAVANFISPENFDEEFDVPDGELSNSLGLFATRDLPRGTYILCSAVIGEDKEACTIFSINPNQATPPPERLSLLFVDRELLRDEDGNFVVLDDVIAEPIIAEIVDELEKSGVPTDGSIAPVEHLDRLDEGGALRSVPPGDPSLQQFCLPDELENDNCELMTG